MTDDRDQITDLDDRTDVEDLPIERTPLVPRERNPLRRKAQPEEAQPVAETPPTEFRTILDDSDLEFETQTQPRYVLWSFIGLVILPTLIAGLYLFFIASDQFTASTQFAVRQADLGMENQGVQPMDPSTPNSITSNGGPSGSSSSSNPTGSMSASGASGSSTNPTSAPILVGQNAQIIGEYVTSRAIIDEIARTLNVRAIFQRPEADFWARLPQDATPEELTKYWKRMVYVYVETATGIVEVRVSAFRREDALALAKAILAASEKLVNTMSLRVRSDLIKLAQDEVRKTDSDVRKSLADLQKFRDNYELITPQQTTTNTSTLLLQLMASKIQTESQLYVAQRTGPNAPGVRAVRAQLESTNKQIDDLQQQLAGKKKISTNMAATISKFEELDLQRQFAEKMFNYATNGLERARLVALQQLIYLAVFVPPALPEDYTYPMRGTNFTMFAGFFLMLWICGATFVSSIIDHRT